MKFPQQISLIMGAVGVAIGAFGAHALGPALEQYGKVDIWNTGIQYFWVHTLASLAISFARPHTPRVACTVIIWLASILLFSGSLFALSMGAPSWVGAITPVGGIGFIIGWLQLLWMREQT